MSDRLVPEPTAARGPESATRETFGFLEALRTLTHRRNIIGGTVLGAMVVGLLLSWVLPDRYMSRTSILPSENTQQGSPLEALTQFGIRLAVDDNSSELFPVVLSSNTIQDAVLDKLYMFKNEDRSFTLTLPKYFDEENTDLLRRRLARMTAISQDRRTGVIELSVVTEYPELSKLIAEEYLKQLENYNLHKRKSRAREYATYLESQLTRSRGELEEAEERLADFQGVNLNWVNTSDPDLIKEMGRLQRDVTAKSTIYLFLDKEVQIARLDVHKDTPIIRVLDSPQVPVERQSPRPLQIVFLAGAVSLLAVVTGVAGYELVRRRSSLEEQAVLSEFGKRWTLRGAYMNRVLHLVSKKSSTAK